MLSTVADPSPLGLAGFSSVILLVSLYNVGAMACRDWIAPAGLLAGIALLVGSYFHFQNAHTFPATTFGFYCAFWTGIAISILLNSRGELENELQGHDFDAIIAYFRVPVAVFTLYARIGSLFVSKASLVLFATLECKLVCFIVGYLAGSPVVTRVGGCCGLVCCSAGFYISASLLLKPFMAIPLGAPLLGGTVPVPLDPLRPAPAMTGPAVRL